MTTLFIFSALYVCLFTWAIYASSKGPYTLDESKGANLSPLRYAGVLYVGKKELAVDCYTNDATGKSFYKIGLQYRDASNGRIVSNATVYAI